MFSLHIYDIVLKDIIQYADFKVNLQKKIYLSYRLVWVVLKIFNTNTNTLILKFCILRYKILILITINVKFNLFQTSQNYFNNV